ncbi:MAG: carboxypeptidase-like regulatory domain-containing protein [Planctomycetes bacterium]|nr:carboxypeptidase-like regulatory domain-containing protein [Planctomycetota bacterium]
MKSKLPIIAIVLLLLSGTIFGGYYYNALQNEEGPCAGLISKVEDPVVQPEQEVVTKIEKPETTPEPEPIKPAAKEPKPTTTDKLSAAEILNEVDSDLTDEQKKILSDEEKKLMMDLVGSVQVYTGNFKHTLSGKVVDSFGEGVKGAQIMLQIDSKDSLQSSKKQTKDKKKVSLRSMRLPPGYVRSYAITDTKGQFTFVFSTNVKEGIDLLNVTMYSQHASHLKSDSQTLVIRKEETTENLNFALKQAGVISGRIVDGFGSPIKGVRVSASMINNLRKRKWSRSMSRQAATDAEGNFKIVGLEDGQYRVYGQATGYRAEPGKRHDVTVVTGQEAYLAGDMILNKQSTLSFTLTSAEGAVSGSSVILGFYNADGKRTNSRSARIGEGGKVTVTNIPTASVQFDVSVKGYGTTTKQYVSITSGEETEFGTITLMKAESNSSDESKKIDSIRELKKKMKVAKSR